MPNNQSQLDQDAVRLAKAIRFTESRDKEDAQGASGEYGLYQFMPETWAKTTQKYNLDPNDRSRANQNKAAYMQIKELKDQGYRPDQIAAFWNSGKLEGWENNVGVNKFGVKFDTPDYVRKVGGVYEGLKTSDIPQTATTTSTAGAAQYAPIEEAKPMANKVADFFGLGKSADTISDLLAPLFIPRDKIVKDPTKILQEDPAQFINKPTGKEIAGAALNVGSYAIPVGGAAKGLTSIVKGILPSKIATTVGHVGAGATTGAAMDVAQDLENNNEIGLGAGTVVGGSIPIAGNILSRTAGKLIPEASGVLTGAGSGPIRRGFQAAQEGGEVGDSFRRALRGNVSPEELVNESRSALQNIVNRRHTEYEKLLTGMKGSNQQLNVKPIFDEFQKQLKNFGIEVGDEGLDFSRSVFRFNTQAQTDIQKIASEMADFGLKKGDRTPIGVDRLKRSFSNVYGDNRDSRALIESMRSMARKTLQEVPGYNEGMKTYEEMTEAIDDIRKGLSLGDKVSTDTAFKKITSALRQNQDFRKQLMQEIDKETGGVLSSKIAGQQLSEIMPRGLMRTVIGAGSITAIASGMYPALLLLIKTSPRVAGEVANILGKTAKDKGIIEDLLIKASSQGVTPSEND